MAVKQRRGGQLVDKPAFLVQTPFSTDKTNVETQRKTAVCMYVRKDTWYSVLLDGPDKDVLPRSEGNCCGVVRRLALLEWCRKWSTPS